jgi:tetratricopeptide (TPR) repeat protein
MKARATTNSTFKYNYLQLARANFEKAILLNSNKGSLRNAGQVDESLLELSMVGATKTDDSKYHMTRAQFHYTSALRLDRNSARTIFAFAQFLFLCGQETQSEEYLLRALILDPNNILALQGYGLLLAHLGKIDEAKKLVARAAKVRGEDLECSTCGQSGHDDRFCRFASRYTQRDEAISIQLKQMSDEVMADVDINLEQLYDKIWYASHLESLRTEARRERLARTLTSWN